MDWFTLRRLADDWAPAVAGARVAAAWTQDERELSLALQPADGEPVTLRVRCDPALALVFRADGAARRKRHTADVLDGLAGRTLTGVYAADRDRVLTLALLGGEALVVYLYGPRPNVLWTAADGSRQAGAATVRDAFLRAPELVGTPAPVPRAAPDPATPDDVAARWPSAAPTLAAAVRRAAPLLPPLLAADAVRAAGLAPDAPAPPSCPDALAESVAALRARLNGGPAVVVTRGSVTEAALPAPLLHVPDGWVQEAFESTNAAVGVWARRALAQARFVARWRPVEAALAAAAARRARAADAMADELAQPSRANEYERRAHLLMATAAGQPAGAESVTVPDVLAGADLRLTDVPDVTIPLDPALSAVENAERLYDRARTARRARAAAESRWAEVAADAERAASLLARVRAVDRLDALDALLADESDAFAALVRPEATGGASEPFHRVALPEGWTALVGKHARGNQHLTTRVARPHDLWLHARGVGGSHVVVPRASRTAPVPESVVQAAAALAARHSQARTQSVVPVTVTERKFVRPVKGGALGLVRVDRERVVDVVL